MLKKCLCCVLAIVLLIGCLPATVSASEPETAFTERDLVQYVNPLIGSDNYNIQGTNKSKFAGLAPFVMAPFAMVNFTPQTQENKIGQISYEYWNRGNNSPDKDNPEGKEDIKISGFFASHQPAIWMGDYCYMNVMPQTGEEIKPAYQDRRLPYSHNDEISTPYYYSVVMGEEGSRIQGEMTATERCAKYRFTFLTASEDNHILIEASRNTNNGTGTVKIDVENQVVYITNSNNMSGQDQKLNNNPPENLRGYYVITFNKPFTVEDVGTYLEYTPTAGSLETEGKAAGAYLTFATTNDNESVEMTIGTSFLSFDQAKQNVKNEIGNKTFEEVKEALKSVWNEKLNIIQVDGATEDELAIFYTAMFHSMMYPRKFYEEDAQGVNHYYSPYDDQVHEGVSYTDFSLWDTFRAQNSFLTLVVPEQVDDMVTSLLQNYQEGGYMPKWPNPNYTNIMIGTHADSIVAEAIQKGLLDESKWNLAYEAVYKDAMVPQEGESSHMWSDREKDVPYEARGGLGAYRALGYVPNRYASEDVSRTMEFAYDDWCVAQVAKAVGKENEYKYFLNRSLNYKNVIDPVSGYAMGRNVNGDWNIDGRFTEGSSQKYTWLALHDPQGLLDLMTEYKGENFYNDELEKAWADKQEGDTDGKLGGWIDQQNEPCHHYAYMFDFSGRPDLTQKYVRKTLQESYFNQTFGMIGNDDCGQMSSWYIFSAMGFYPVNPASGEYMIGSPIFDKVTIHNPKTGTDFVITADNNKDDANMYIQSATLNGSALNEPVITYQQITEGGSLHFVMGSEPSDWGSDYRKKAIVKDETVEEIDPDFEAPYMIDSQARFWLEDLMDKPGTTVAVTASSIPQYEVPTNIGKVEDGVLTDGNYNTGFRSDTIKGSTTLDKRPFYITVTWTEGQTVDCAYLFSSQALRNTRYITKVNVEVSTDGVNYTTAATDLAVNWEASGPSGKQITSDVAKISFPVQENVKSLRLQVTGAKLQSNCFDLTELEIYNESSVSTDHDVQIEIRYNANKLTDVMVAGTSLNSSLYSLSRDDASGYQSKYENADKNNILTIKAEAFENTGLEQIPIVLKFNHGKDITLGVEGEVLESSADVWVNVAARASEVDALPGQTNNSDLGGPEAMIDGNHLKGYTTAKGPELPFEITLTWEEPQSFDKVKIFTNNGVKNGPTDITFLVSEDGENWEIVAEHMTLTWLISDPKNEPEGVLIQLPNELKDVTHLKLQIHAYNNNNNQISIRELELYNKEGEAVEFAKEQYTGEDAKNIEFMLIMNNASFTKISDGTRELVKDVDFNLSEVRQKPQLTESNQTLTLSPEYAASLGTGENVFTVTFTSLDGVSITKEIKINLTEEIKTEKGALQELYDANKEKTRDDYTEESWADFKEALDNAKAVLEDGNATQEQVDEAYDALSDAIKGLTETKPEENEKPEKPIFPVLPIIPGGSNTVKPTDPMDYTDVSKGDRYYDDILYVYENGIMNGTGNNKFSPNATLTRAMVVTILYRMEGEPSVRYNAMFPDVENYQWYTDGVEWAAREGIVLGYTNGKFGPNDPVTREQLVTILYRYAQSKNYVLADGADLSAITDVSNVSPYAVSAVKWAVREDLLDDANGKLQPRQNATRAEVAHAIAGFCRNVGK